MSRPSKRLPGCMELFAQEAARRALKLPLAQRTSNKQLAKASGLVPMYVAQIVAKMRRDLERRVEITPDTSTHRPAEG